MRVYRVENEKGEGPYQADPRPRWASWRVPWDSTPAPSADFPWLRELREAGVYYDVLKPLHFGFPSREAAVAWFGEDGLVDLTELGFPLRVFEVCHAVVAPSGRQCLFCRRLAMEVTNATEAAP